MGKKSEHIYNYIKQFILNYGERRDKKHGNWILLKIGKEAFLQIDSWNGYIHYGMCPIYCYWNGFGGYSFLGGNWGGYTAPKDLRFQKYIYDRLINKV